MTDGKGISGGISFPLGKGVCPQTTHLQTLIGHIVVIVIGIVCPVTLGGFAPAKIPLSTKSAGACVCCHTPPLMLERLYPPQMHRSNRHPYCWWVVVTIAFRTLLFGRSYQALLYEPICDARKHADYCHHFSLWQCHIVHGHYVCLTTL